MITLSLDTSSIQSSLAIFKDDCLLSSTRHHSQKLHTGLFVLIEKTLKDHQITPEQIDRVITGIGPGSFTGVRIGVSFARTLCQLTKADLIPVESFYLSYNDFQPEIFYVPTIPSTKSECYASLFKINIDNSIQTIKPVDDGSPERIVDWLSHIPDSSDVVIYGEAVKMLDGLSYLPSLEIEIIYPEFSMPDARRAFQFIQTYSEKNKSIDPLKLTPLYVRPSPAETNRQKEVK